MSRVRVSADLAPVVQQFAADFAAVTGQWVAEGWHTPAEVEGWRVEIRKIFDGGAARDVLDVCKTWRKFARDIQKG